MASKKIIAYMNAENSMVDSCIEQAVKYSLTGADELYIYNYSKNGKEREEYLHLCRELIKKVDITCYAGCYTERFEDIKKAFYTGAEYVVIPYEYSKEGMLYKEATDRFGKDKIYACLNAGAGSKEEEATFTEEVISRCISYGVEKFMIKHFEMSDKNKKLLEMLPSQVIIRDSLNRNTINDILELEKAGGIATNYYKENDIYKVKQTLKKEGIDVNSFECSMRFSELKTGADGLVPVIVQDFKTNEVLMLAYMNEEAYNKTISTGKMTYFSRSRQSLWVKGETSGHYQYVMKLAIDCDNDTILATVKQIGAACHTGARSCFYRDIVKKEYTDSDPLHVLTDVYDVIMDRKNNPKEGSYTNYLFDKGIDKILKKCGEEAAEIIIAAKNPDPEEIKYEISDFLYHMMVLMAERGVDWDDITKELSHRK